MQAAGNHFVVLDARETGERDWASLAVWLCRERSGPGGDGLLVVLDGQAAPVRMRMFNPDGTEDDCGNGLRCVALYARERGRAPNAEFAVETRTGTKPVEVLGAGLRADVRTGMGKALLDPAAIPILLERPNALEFSLHGGGREFTASSVFTGSTHTVIFERPDDGQFHAWSRSIETHDLFPQRTSVLWTSLGPEPTSGETRASVRIWERGVGETLACGTGAAAVAVVLRCTGRAPGDVRVQSRGGELRVHVEDDLAVVLTGPAAFVYRGVWIDTPDEL